MFAMKEHTRETTTNIRVKRTTKADLEPIADFGESYDDVIQKLINVYRAASELVRQLPSPPRQIQI